MRISQAVVCTLLMCTSLSMTAACADESASNSPTPDERIRQLQFQVDGLRALNDSYCETIKEQRQKLEALTASGSEPATMRTPETIESYSPATTEATPRKVPLTAAERAERVGRWYDGFNQSVLAPLNDAMHPNYAYRRDHPSPPSYYIQNQGGGNYMMTPQFPY